MKRGFAALVLLAARAARADESNAYELREEITGVAFASKAYDVPGSCATGGGTAPASLYASAPSGAGAALGIGVGGRIGHHFTGRFSGHGATLWGVRVGGGLDLALLYGSLPSGVDDPSGKLCARVKSDGVPLQYRGSAVLLTQLPLFLGPELGLGTLESDGEWHGVVLGAAWAPAFTYLKPWGSGGELRVTDLGAELSMDFVTVRDGTARQTGTRVAVHLLAPAQAGGPLLGTVSVGILWY